MSEFLQIELTLQIRESFTWSTAIDFATELFTTLRLNDLFDFISVLVVISLAIEFLDARQSQHAMGVH